MSNNNYFRKTRKDGIWSLVISVIKVIVEEILGEIIIGFLKMVTGEFFLTEILDLSMDNQFWSTIVYFIIIFLILSSPEIIAFIKNRNKEEDISISFIPQSGKITEGLWDSKYAWLEILGVLDTGEYTGFLKKLESKNDEVTTDWLSQITKSSSPRLKMVEEKLFIIKTNVGGGKAQIFLNKGESSFLPEDIKKFYFEVELVKNREPVQSVKGYLLDKYGGWKIRISQTEQSPTPR